MPARRRSLRAATLAAAGAIASAALVLAGLTPASAAPPEPVTLQQRDDSVVTADPLPTVQIDSGYVWAQAMIGTTVYAVGGFSNARAPLAAPGTNLTPRANVLAYDITTGGLLSWAPQVNGPVRSVAVSPDGRRVYIGGSFNQVNGQTRWNFAALDAQTGQLVPGFSPSIGGSGVFGIVSNADTVYLTGRFTQANGQARQNNAAFATANGALRPWAPTTDRQGDAIVLEPATGQVILGGRFYLTNGVVQRGLASIDPVTGALDQSWLAPQTVINGWSSGSTAGKAGIFALATDATGVYGTGWVYANVQAGNLEGAFAAEAGSGAIRWIADCHGDHYGIWSTGETVYTTNHTHQCDTVGLAPELNPRTFRYVEAFTATAEGTLTRTPSVSDIYKDWSGYPAPAPYAWYPDFTVGRATEMGEAGLSITGTGDFIAIAGEFPSVNNQRYQGIVRFSTEPASGARQGPRIASADWVPSASSALPGRVRVAIPGNWDRDDRDLTYELRRSGTAGVVASRTVGSSWWSQPTITFDDTSVSPGATHTYTVRAVDGDGNAVTSSPVTVTVASGEASAYANAVLDDGATLYYPLGTSTADVAGGNPPVFGTGTSVRTPGAVRGPTGATATAFNGTQNGRVSSTSSAVQPSSLSIELWFSTTTNQGGKLIGLGSAQTGSSGSYDRHIYMRNDGRLVFGAYPGQVRTITSSSAYNDGQWHHAVATLGASGIALYVDGALVAQDASTTSGEPFRGFWRIGGDNLGSWPNQPSSSWFSGAIDEVAIYGNVLSASRIAAHHQIGNGQLPPTAAFTSSTSNLTASFDATGSTADTGASITGYSWDFGDGTAAGTGATPSHPYAASGTYRVTLTVTDSRGATDTEERDVTVQAANVLPTAAFTPTISQLALQVDGTASDDPDGDVVSYAWSWGDGTAPGSGATASHAYAAGGSYTVTLTVTDDRGGTATASQVVTATAPPAPAFAAQDDFARTATSSWGTADVGGAWTVEGGSAAAASVASGTGRLTLAAGSTRNVMLRSTDLRDVRVSVDVSLDAAPSTGIVYAGIVARSRGTDDYRVRAWMRDNGTVWLVLQRGSTVLRSVQVPGITRAAGDTFTIEAEITGGTSTTLSATLWRAGTPRPAGWQATATDASSTGLSGAIGLHGNRAGSATTAGVLSFDALRVTNLG